MLKIKEIREAKKLTQDDVVAKTGIRKRSYVDYENEKSDIPLLKLQKIATALNVGIAELIDEGLKKTKSEENLNISNVKINVKENVKERNMNKTLTFQEKEPSPPDHSRDEIMQLLKENKKLVEEKNKLLENENERLNKEVSRLTAANSLLSTENANLQAQNKDLSMQIDNIIAENNAFKKGTQNRAAG